MLEEIGLPYNHVVCKPWSRVAKSVHPLGKVPALLVDCIRRNSSDNDVDDADAEIGEKFVVLESAAINTFLGDLAREVDVSDGERTIHNLLVPQPATPIRAKYDSLVLFVMTELDAQSLWIHRKHDDLSSIFGEASTAVQEARRQFDNALDVMIAEIDTVNGEGMYLLGRQFSAVDILFANCCFWAQQINWLEKDPSSSGSTETTTASDATTAHATDAPKQLDPKLASYLQRIRSRPAFMKANELRKNQVHEEKERRSSKL